MLKIIIVLVVLGAAFIGGALVMRKNRKTADKVETVVNDAVTSAKNTFKK